MGTPVCFSAFSFHYFKGDNHCKGLFVFLGNKAHVELGSTLKGKNSLPWSEFFSSRVDPFEKGRRNDSGRVTALSS